MDSGGEIGKKISSIIAAHYQRPGLIQQQAWYMFQIKAEIVSQEKTVAQSRPSCEFTVFGGTSLCFLFPCYKTTWSPSNCSEIIIFVFLGLCTTNQTSIPCSLIKKNSTLPYHTDKPNMANMLIYLSLHKLVSRGQYRVENVFQTWYTFLLQSFRQLRTCENFIGEKGTCILSPASPPPFFPFSTL